MSIEPRGLGQHLLSLPSHCFLKIGIGGEVQDDPIVIALRTKECPKTCQNFIALCTSANTTTPSKPSPTYRGCDFHRIIDNFMVQAGDFENFDGSGGYSPLHGKGKPFPDEDFSGKHDAPGIVSMANKGKDTNGSQFFITLRATPHLDRKHVVLGKVIKGMSTVEKMLLVEKNGDRPVPLQRVTIVDCGIGDGGVIAGSSEYKSESKRHRKHKRKKKRRHRDYSSDDSSTSSSSSSSSREERKRKKEKRRKKLKRRRREESASSEDRSRSHRKTSKIQKSRGEDSSPERRKSEKKQKKRHREEHRRDK